MPIDTLELGIPRSSDGMAVNRLVAESPPLDTNSAYCNLLQCTHFSDTCIIAKQMGDLVGFVSGYIIPKRKDCFFVWQVVVSRKARGLGLGTKMLESLLSRPICREVSYLETTITQSNEASWALFRKFARRMNAEVDTSVAFDRDLHFEGLHDTEILMRIGPFDGPQSN